jgi:pimeloyl-ACP methyl ester carboxylesterase
MGDQDHLFLPNVKKVVAQHQLASLNVIPDCGHVVNVQKPQVFNQESLSFLQSL